MTRLRRFARELWGLFIDDGIFALAILIWIGLCIASPAELLPDHWKSPVLFVGIAAILIRSAAGAVRS